MMRMLSVVLISAAAVAALAQSTGEEPRNAPARATEVPSAGFWPTQRMLERMIDRLVDEMADDYEFDDQQVELTKQLLYDRIPGFLNANRAEIQTLMNQYIEALLEDEPPPVETVAQWATRVQPLLAEFEQVCVDIAESMDSYLNEDQSDRLANDLGAFQAGLSLVQKKLGAWAAGGFDPDTEWPRKPKQRRGRADGAAERQPAEEATATAQAPPAEPLDEWALYTQQFIKRYQLNAEQRQRAYAMLRRQQEARDRYLRRKTAEMARVTRMLKEAETEEQRQKALEAYERLNAPIEKMFQALKDRLETLPTRAQRRAAEPAAPATRPTPPPAPETRQPD